MTHTRGPLYAVYNGIFWSVSTGGGGCAPSVGYSPEESYARLFAASPDMLAALLAVERAEQLSNVCGDDPDAIEEWIEASNDAMEKVNAVLKRLRDAKVIEKAEGRTK